MNRCAALLLALATSLTAQEAAEVRAVWVTRWDWKTEEDLRATIGGLAELGANRVLLQVRGHACTYWSSELEPWDPWLTSGKGGDPGWDPIRVAIEAAKEHGVALELWMNAMPLWRGLDPPTDPAHPYLAHPEWIVVGSDGKPQKRTAHYVCANPALPAVRAHVAAVAGELAARYAVDAIHLDYIRYVTDEEQTLDFSHDPASLKAFGKDPAKEPEGWSRWKAEQVTATVREVRAAVRAARPSCRLTAAVFPTAASRRKVAQDVETWSREGLVDAIYPMTYAASTAEFEKRLADCMGLGLGKVPVYPGLGVFQHKDTAETRRQLERARAAGAKGVALFCYASLFESTDPAELKEGDVALRAKRVELIQELWGRSR